MSKIFDMFDEVISCLFEEYDDNNDLVVLIGKENPFNENCATVFFKKKIIFGVLGPKRMNYDKVISVMSELRGLIEQKVKEESI
jgi:transcriptional regulator of heat shock response